MKKVLTALLSVVLILGMSTTFFADELTPTESKQGIFIATEPVPKDAIDYAKGFMETLSDTELEILEIEGNVEDISLAQGFTVENSEPPIYYFPILSGDKAEAMLIIKKYKGEYGFQGSGGEFARNLNTLQTDASNPARILCTENAYYAVDRLGVHILQSLPIVSEETLEKEKKQIASKKFSNQPKEVAHILREEAYDINFEKNIGVAIRVTDEKGNPMEGLHIVGQVPVKLKSLILKDIFEGKTDAEGCLTNETIMDGSPLRVKITREKNGKEEVRKYKLRTKGGVFNEYTIVWKERKFLR